MTGGYGKCNNDASRCVPWCNGRIDCIDGSDEKACEEVTCAAGSIKCADNLQCIKVWAICDGMTHCLDVSDELCTASCLQVRISEFMCAIYCV